jgi:hypothetical protein
MVPGRLNRGRMKAALERNRNTDRWVGAGRAAVCAGLRYRHAATECDASFVDGRPSVSRFLWGPPTRVHPHPRTLTSCASVIMRGGRRPGGRPSRDDGCSASLSFGNGCGRLQPTTSSTSRRHGCEQTQPIEVWLTSPGGSARALAATDCSQCRPALTAVRRQTRLPSEGSRARARWLAAFGCKPAGVNGGDRLPGSALYSTRHVALTRRLSLVWLLCCCCGRSPLAPTARGQPSLPLHVVPAQACVKS